MFTNEFQILDLVKIYSNNGKLDVVFGEDHPNEYLSSDLVICSKTFIYLDILTCI